MTDPIIGIDLGTSNTVVAHASETGQVQVLADANGYKIHPSVVSFHPTGGVVVGAAAKQRKVIDPKNTIFSVKRLIGRSFSSPEVQTAKQRMPYTIKEGQNSLPIVVTRGGEFAVPEISAIVLDHVRTIASTQLKTDVGRAVVTVPASFNDAQRSATATAGSIAGLTVVRVLNEPTAAALAYGAARNLNETIAVYDFGGGTFDITILRLADQVYEVLGTAGNTFLGGDDLDERLVDRMVEKFLAENRVDLRTNEVSMMRLRAVAEQTKIELSRRSRAVVRVDEIAYGPKGKPLDLQIEIRRDEFVSQVADIIDKTFPVCTEALKYANLTIDGIDDVILVGGTTKIPYVRDQVAKYFAKAPRTDVNPEDAVAVGAAHQAKALERVLARKKSSQVPVPKPAADFTQEEGTFGGNAETETFTRGEDKTNELTFSEEDQTHEGPRKRSTNTYDEALKPPRTVTHDRAAARGEHHDRFGEVPTPPPAPAGPVLGRLTKDIKPPAARTTAQGVAAKGPRKTAMAVPIMRVPAKISEPASRESSTIIVDPSATNPGVPPTSEDLDFPDSGTEKGFLDLDDAMQTSPVPPTSEDLDFPDAGTEKGFLDLDDAMSPASTAKGFSPPPANTLRTMDAAVPPAPPTTLRNLGAQRPPAPTSSMPAPPPPPPVAPPSARTMIGDPPSAASARTMIGDPTAPPSAASARTMIGDPPAPPSAASARTMIGAQPPTPASARTMIGAQPPPSPASARTLIVEPPVPPPAAEPSQTMRDPREPSVTFKLRGSTVPPPVGAASPTLIAPSPGRPATGQGPLTPPVWPPPGTQPMPPRQNPVVMDVTPRGLGIGTVSGFCEELIRRNSRVPTETRKLFSTSRDHQDSVRIVVCQGESRRLDQNMVIGDLVLQNLPRRPRGETSIEVTFHLDASGILQVRARDSQTGNEQSASLDLVGAMPQQEVDASRERLQALRR